MITITRNADGTIKTYSEKVELDFTFTNGESVEYLDTTFEEYASRLIISCHGKSGETLFAKVGDPALVVEVSCPNQQTVDLSINDTIETLPLTMGKGQLTLATDQPGVYLIQPADRKTYAAAGISLLSVEIKE